MKRWCVIAMLCGVTVGCEGTMMTEQVVTQGGDEQDPSGPDETGAMMPDQGNMQELPDGGVIPTPPGMVAPMPLKRLTSLEFRQTLEDLFDGAIVIDAEALPAEAEIQGFENDASTMDVDEVRMGDLLDASLDAAVQAYKNAEAVSACDESAHGSDGAQAGRACARAFLEAHADRIWRRPVDPAEYERLLDHYAQNRFDEQELGNHHRSGMVAMLAMMWMSPDFLYKLEAPQATASVLGQGERLNDWQLASRLSYFLWRSMPDEALFEAARAGTLQQDDVLRAQVERMLDSPRAELSIAEFHKRWLNYQEIDNPRIRKSAQMFPEWADARQDLPTSSRRLVTRIVLEERGDFAALFGSPTVEVSQTTAPIFGVEFDPDGEPWQRFDLPGERFGVLTDPSFLAVNSRPTYVSPVTRGYTFRERVFCDTVAPAAEAVMMEDPILNEDGSASSIDPFSFTMERADCAYCHVNMNPVGYGFSQFNAIGAFDDMPFGEPLEFSGQLAGTDVPEPFSDIADFAARVQSSQQARECMTRQWFRYAHGYADKQEHAELIAELTPRGDEPIRDVLVAIALSDSFRSR